MRAEAFSTPGEVTLVLRVPAGEIEIEAEAEAEASGETAVQLEARSGKPEAEAAARIEARDRGGRSEILVEAPRDDVFRREEYRVRISLPEGAGIDATVGSADIEARGRYGVVEVTTASGDVVIHEVAALNAKAASGDVVVQTVRRSLNVQTASGDVVVKRVAGDGKIRTASGDVGVRVADSGLTVQTASGDQAIGSVAAGEVALQSASGDISVGIRPGSRLWVDARSISGETSSELDVGETPPDGDGPMVELRASTISGDIRVVRAPASEDAVTHLP